MPADLIEKISEYQSYCDRLASQATRFSITGDLAQALDIYQKIRTIEPSYPRINMMIRSVEAEMGRPYIDRYGRVREELVFSNAPPLSTANRPRSTASRRSRILVILLVGAAVLVLVVIVSLLL